MNKYLKLWLGTIFCFSSFATESTKEGFLSSTNATYDGSALLLSGHVVLDHGLGKMTAEEASLQKQEVGKDFPFSIIHLHKEVLLSLKNQGTLLCDRAELDFSSLKGYLTAPTSGSVCYTDHILQKGNKDRSVILKSSSIDLSLLRHDPSDKKTEYDIETVVAKDRVNINFNQEFILDADHALYRKTLHDSSVDKEFQGTITAYPKDSTSFCTIRHDGDTIEASSIDLNLIHSIVSLHKAKGSIAASLLPIQNPKIHFASDFITWNSPQETLSLKGHSEIHESTLGTIHTEEELMIEQSVSKGKKMISKISTKGPSTLTYSDPSTKALHKLFCKGMMKVDREHLNAQLSSPKSEGKKTSIAEQVYYEEASMGVYADSAFVEFSAQEQTLEPVSLSLKGSVCMFSRGSQEPFRCGIADRMSYCPSTKTLILSANPGRKVLFFDEQQAVRMSAQEVHLTQNPTTHQAVIQGVGNVKFSLSVEENEVLNKFFPQYKPMP
jgi:hypothetical protein